jgi:hypothetical protein
VVFKVVLAIVAVIVALSIISFLVSALKWLLIIAGIVFILSLVGGWTRRSSRPS